MSGMHDNSFNKLNNPSDFIKRLDVIIQEDKALNVKYNDLIYWLKSLVMYNTHGEAGIIKDYNVYLSQGFTTLEVGQNHTLLHALTAIDNLLSQIKTSKVVFINREQPTIPTGLGVLNDIVLSTSNNTLYRFDGTRYISIGKFRKDTLYIKDYDEDFIIYKSIDNNTLITNQVVDCNSLDIESDKNYVYDQPTPSKEWDIIHNLNKKPSCTIIDSAGTVIEGKVVINDGVRILIEFNAPFTGSVILN